MKYGLFYWVLAGLFLAPTITAEAAMSEDTCRVNYLGFPEQLYSKRFVWENDSGYSDEQYTNGIRWERTLYSGCELFTDPSQNNKASFLSRSLRWLHHVLPGSVDSKNTHFGYAFGMNLYTPNQTDLNNDKLPDPLIANDRPYSGWAYYAFSISSTKLLDDIFPAEISKFEFMLGAIGASARQDNVQNAFHVLIDNDISQGWDNQQEGGFAINASLTRNNYTYSDNRHFRYELGYVYMLGMVRTEVTGNLGVAYTTDNKSWRYLDKSLITPTKQAAADRNIIQSRQAMFKQLRFATVSLAVQPRYKFYDYFLDEDSATGSHTYSRNDFVYDQIASFDFKVSGSKSIFAFRYIERSKEIDTISHDHKFWQFMWQSYFH